MATIPYPGTDSQYLYIIANAIVNGGGAGAAGVSSFNGRTGAVTLQASDVPANGSSTTGSAGSFVALTSTSALPAAASTPVNTTYAVLVATSDGYNLAFYTQISGSWVQTL